MHVIESPTLEFRSFIDQQEYWQGVRGMEGGGDSGTPGIPLATPLYQSLRGSSNLHLPAHIKADHH